MSHQALIDTCRTCAESCTRCASLMDGVDSFNDCPHCCRACAAVCGLVEILTEPGGIHFIQSLRLCVSISGWCAAQCSEQADPDFLDCASLCLACRDACQAALEEQVSDMVQHD